ncbi:MAG: hypothetical protein RLZZ519_2504 [Bacteroidota bacterium]|jgi:hypothetical protein
MPLASKFDSKSNLGHDTGGKQLEIEKGLITPRRSIGGMHADRGKIQTSHSYGQSEIHEESILGKPIDAGCNEQFDPQLLPRFDAEGIVGRVKLGERIRGTESYSEHRHPPGVFAFEKDEILGKRNGHGKIAEGSVPHIPSGGVECNADQSDFVEIALPRFVGKGRNRLKDAEVTAANVVSLRVTYPGKSQRTQVAELQCVFEVRRWILGESGNGKEKQCDEEGVTHNRGF